MTLSASGSLTEHRRVAPVAILVVRVSLRYLANLVPQVA